MRRRLIINAIGGLANRMRAMASGIVLARETGRAPLAVWAVNSDLRARFDDLFIPVPDDGKVEIVTPSAIGYALKWELPRKRNLFLSALWRRYALSGTLDDGPLMYALADNHPALASMVEGAKGDFMITSGLSFADTPRELFLRLFRPSPRVCRLIGERKALLGADAVGVHIRRTDNSVSVSSSPLHLFEKKMDGLIEAYRGDSLRFFLASDDPQTIRSLERRYGRRIVTGDRNASRTTLSGMTNAAADMFTLSSTRLILGSHYSSFSEIAAVMGGTPLEIMKV